MRVLHVSKIAGIGGSERHLLDLLPRLEREGVEARLLVLRAPGAERFLEALEELRIGFATLDAGRDTNPRLVADVAREIRRRRPEIVHTHLVHADVFGQAAARLCRVPAVSSMHSTLASFLREPVRTAERVALRSARRVIAISHHVASWLGTNRLAPPGRIRVVPYGVDAARWSLDGARDEARHRWGLPSDAFVVAMASRLIEGKGHRTAFEAVERAAEQHPEVLLAVAGVGELETELRHGAGERVRFLGFVEDVAAFLAACDAVIVPTEPRLGEGFGLAALEAMAAGRPVIVTAVASLPEVVGAAGTVIPPGDAGALASAIIGLATDAELASRLGAAGRDRARREYGLDRMVRGTLNVYAEIR